MIKSSLNNKSLGHDRPFIIRKPLYEVLEANIPFDFYIFVVLQRLLLSTEIPVLIEKIKLQFAVSFYKSLYLN